MSNFIKQTKHPVTGEWEEASWLDDFFGKHIYGVQFIKDAVVYNADEIKFETRETSVKTTPQEEWEDVLYKFTLGSLHLSLEKRHEWYKDLIKSEKEKSVEETFLDIANNPSKIREFWKREARQEVLREVREKIEKLETFATENYELTRDIKLKKVAIVIKKSDLLSTLESKE